MDINTKSRQHLREHFKKNEIPDEADFKDLIEAPLNQRDDGLARPPGEPVSVEADTAAGKPVLHLYESFTGIPAWRVSLRDGDAESARAALVVSDSARNARFTIDQETGQVKVGTLETTGDITAGGAIHARSGLRVPHGQVLDVYKLRAIPTGIAPGGGTASDALHIPNAPDYITVDGGLTVEGAFRARGLITAEGGLTVPAGQSATITESLHVPKGIRVGPGNMSSHLDVDGALYRCDYNTYITVDDRFYIRKVGAASAAFFFDTTNKRIGVGMIGQGTPQSALHVHSDGGRQISANDWVDVSAGSNGRGLFAANAYLASNEFRYTKGSPGFGAIGLAVNHPYANRASIISSRTTSSEATRPFDPFRIATFSDAGLEIPTECSVGVRTIPTSEYALDVKGNVRIQGILRGSPNDYARAQHTLHGGGIVTWGGPDGRLRWTRSFLAFSAGRPSAMVYGWMGIGASAAGQKVIQDWDNVERACDETGVVLHEKEALYAVHGAAGWGGPNEVTLRVVAHDKEFQAPSNWILVAIVHPHDEGKGGRVTLGTGTILDYWRSPTLDPMWTRYDESFGAPPGYYKDSAGIVRLRGLLKAAGAQGANPFTYHSTSPAGGYTLFQLPQGYRPGNRLLFAVVTQPYGDNNIAGRVDVLPDGTVKAVHGSREGICLDGISFVAEQ